MDEIAERSYLLALSAGILAAGAEGAAFGPVSTEMKTLAEQCKESTLQVRQLIGEIAVGIEDSVASIRLSSQLGRSGHGYADEASVAIHQLDSQVQDADRAFSQIVAATRGQQLALAQMTEALASIRDASVRSTEVTRELEHSGKDLTRLSRLLTSSL